MSNVTYYVVPTPDAAAILGVGGPYYVYEQFRHGSGGYDGPICECRSQAMAQRIADAMQQAYNESEKVLHIS